MQPDLEKASLAYTYCYCEENIWKLCDRLRELHHDLSEFSVVFVSNGNDFIYVDIIFLINTFLENKTVPFFKQGDEGPLVWVCRNRK